MASLPLLWANIMQAAFAVLITGAYAASTVLLGAQFAPRITVDAHGLEILIHFALGAAIFGLVFALLAMAKVAYSPLVIALALSPLALLLKYRHAFRRPDLGVGFVRSLSGEHS